MAYCYTTANTCDYYWEYMEHLEFWLGGETEPFRIPPWAYSFSGDNYGTPACLVAVSFVPQMEGIEQLTILGDSFLRQYVTSFNYTDNTVTLGINANRPVQTYPNVIGQYIWMTICVIAFLGMIVMLCLCIQSHQRRQAAYARNNRQAAYRPSPTHAQPPQVTTQYVYMPAPQ